MEERKKIKLSLGTCIAGIIAIALFVGIVCLWMYYFAVTM